MKKLKSVHLIIAVVLLGTLLFATIPTRAQNFGNQNETKYSVVDNGDVLNSISQKPSSRTYETTRVRLVAKFSPRSSDPALSACWVGGSNSKGEWQSYYHDFGTTGWWRKSLDVNWWFKLNHRIGVGCRDVTGKVYGTWVPRLYQNNTGWITVYIYKDHIETFPYYKK